jgi:hypothetical protein
VVDLQGASWLASANYAGYLVGAVLCTLQPGLWQRLRLRTPVQPTRMVRVGLAATAILTLAMGLQLPGLWPALRFCAGLASALVFIYTSGWCLARLGELQVPALGAVIYVGPGAGIVLSGLAASALVAVHGRAATGWLVFGLIASLLTALVWRVFSPAAGGPVAPMAPAAAPLGAAGSTPELALLTLAYGLAGFGYIITATFLPVIARTALPGSPWLDLFWPLFGTGVIAGALLASRVRAAGDLRRALAACYLVQAASIAVGLASPTPAGFALSSLLLGLPFTAITFFAMQEVRRIRPVNSASFMGLLTAFYGVGQVAGPPLAAALVARQAATPATGFSQSLVIAAASLALGAVLYELISRLYPMPVSGTT